MTRPCYRCESGKPALPALGLCADCAMEVRSEAHRAPLIDTCGKCSHVFVNDWERLKHEVVGSHNYRAWTDPSSKKGRAA
jgi:Zn-finger nucleic acid-binding protein